DTASAARCAGNRHVAIRSNVRTIVEENASSSARDGVAALASDRYALVAIDADVAVIRRRVGNVAAETDTGSAAAAGGRTARADDRDRIPRMDPWNRRVPLARHVGPDERIGDTGDRRDRHA